MEGLLPDTLRWDAALPASGQPFIDCLRGPDGERLAMLAHDPPEVLGGIVDAAALRAVHDRFTREPSFRDGALLFRAAVVAEWLAIQGSDGAAGEA